MTRFPRELIERVVRNEPDAVAIFQTRATPLVMETIKRLLWARARSRGDLREVSEELCQEVFIKLFQRDWRVLREWDSARRPLEALLYTITKHCALDYLRSGRRRAGNERLSREPTPGWLERAVAAARGALGLGDRASTAPEDEICARLLLRRVIAEVRAELPEQRRELFDLLFIEQRSNEEIAAQIGMKQNTIDQNRRRLRMRLKKKMAELSDD